MKKFTMTFLAALLAVSLSAQGIGLSINIDPIGYMNHTIVTKYNGLGGLKVDLQKELEATLGAGKLEIGDQKQTDIYNAYALGLDVKYSYFYLALSLGLPAKIYTNGFDPIAVAWPDAYKNNNKIGGTTILDGHLGGGIPLMKDKPLNFFVGGGIAVNYVHVKRDISEDSSLYTKLGYSGVTSLVENRNIVQAGLGLKAELNYDFMPNVGFNLSLSDSLHFIKIYSQRKFAGVAKGLTFNYFLTETGKDNDSIKSQFANNFVLRLGVGLKF
ncbi:MAG: hypothetical protein P1P64_07130 [Treponemataceae bacterium]